MKKDIHFSGSLFIGNFLRGVIYELNRAKGTKKQLRKGDFECWEREKEAIIA